MELGLFALAEQVVEGEFLAGFTVFAVQFAYPMLEIGQVVVVGAGHGGGLSGVGGFVGGRLVGEGKSPLEAILGLQLFPFFFFRVVEARGVVELPRLRGIEHRHNNIFFF